MEGGHWGGAKPRAGAGRRSDAVRGGHHGGVQPHPCSPRMPKSTESHPCPYPNPCPITAVPGLCALLPSPSSSSSSPVPYLSGVQSAEAVWPLPGLGPAIKSRGQAEGVTRIWELLAGESRGARVGLEGVLSVRCCCCPWAVGGILPGSRRAQSWVWIWPLHHEFWIMLFGA